MAEPFDIVIIGAGISGIGMAAHLRRQCPGKRFAIVERRDRLGGTWDLFRYPGIRSDSDMFTLGYGFEPWQDERAIADAPSILRYLDGVADRYGIREHIRFGEKAVAADWDSDSALWTVRTESKDGAAGSLSGRFLFFGSGYYDYDAPHDPEIPGLGTFGGLTIHPQFWPDNIDYNGKNVVVIGSGATAATVVPAMARTAGHVTMLQRTPSWYLSRPARDGVAGALRKLLPARLAYALTRMKNVALQHQLIQRSRSKPEAVRQWLQEQLEKELGSDYDRETFTPPYNPWEQRMCLIPDGDLFRAMREGKADIVTGHIAQVDRGGIRLADGRYVAADIIVTATGLRIATLGKVAVSLDGRQLDFSETFYYRNCMFSNVPNLAALFGYLNAAWTLRVDSVADWLCRLFNHMDRWGVDVVTPHLAENHGLVEAGPLDYFSSGYLQRARHLIPKSSTTAPWRLSMDYPSDRRELRDTPIDDGVLRFARAVPVLPDSRHLS